MKGYRAFGLKADEDRVIYLNGPASGQAPLEYPTTRALCGHGRHRAPDTKFTPGQLEEPCMCGYNAYTELGGAASYAHDGEANIMAEVHAHGTTVQYDLGWRSERLQVLAFYWPLCQERGCLAPVTTCAIYSVDELNATAGRRALPREWPPPLRVVCEQHALDMDKLVAHTSDDRRTRRQQEAWENNGIVSAMSLDLESRIAPVWTMDASEMVGRLSQRFAANVYDYAATMAVYEAAVDWQQARGDDQERKGRAREINYAIESNRREQKAEAQRRGRLRGNDNLFATAGVATPGERDGPDDYRG